MLVGKGDFSVVRAALVLAVEGRRRLVGRVRIVEVHPEKERLAGIARQPLHRLVHHHIPRTLHQVEIGVFQAVEIEVVVVKIKSLVQTEAVVEHGGTEHGSGGVPLLPQNGGQGRLLRIQPVAAEIVNAAVHGVGAGHHHGVRRQGDGHRSIGVLETGAVGSQGVNVRGARLAVAIAAQVVGPQGVNSNQQQVVRRGRVRFGRRRRPSGKDQAEC